MRPEFEVASMKWEKLGLIFDAKLFSNGQWFCNSALTPQPYRLSANIIRVFSGFRDAEGISRIGYVDLDSFQPRSILNISEKPVLDLGRDGCFDDNGMILGDVVDGPDGIYLFYVGFQLVRKAKFLAFTGVAVAEDIDHGFRRISEAPILDRATNQTTIGAIHTARYESGVWRLWFARGDGWELIDGKPFPKYNICYTETKDLFNIPKYSHTCVDNVLPEYRIGRPKVYSRANGEYVMYATRGTLSGDYFPSFFRSNDGIKWERDDSMVGIARSISGWDSETICYPALIQNGDSVLMLYNGRRMGFDGFGAAVCKEISII
jgi:hypothetical protein